MAQNPSSLHWTYVLVELIKVASLVYLGVKRNHATAPPTDSNSDITQTLPA